MLELVVFVVCTCIVYKAIDDTPKPCTVKTEPRPRQHRHTPRVPRCADTDHNFVFFGDVKVQCERGCHEARRHNLICGTCFLVLRPKTISCAPPPPPSTGVYR